MNPTTSPFRTNRGQWPSRTPDPSSQSEISRQTPPRAQFHIIHVFNHRDAAFGYDMVWPILSATRRGYGGCLHVTRQKNINWVVGHSASQTQEMDFAHDVEMTLPLGTVKARRALTVFRIDLCTTIQQKAAGSSMGIWCCTVQGRLTSNRVVWGAEGLQGQDMMTCLYSFKLQNDVCLPSVYMHKEDADRTCWYF